MNFVDTTVVLTGATGGIGQAVAKLLGARGAKLLLVSRNEQQLAQLCQSLGANHRYVAADITSEQGRANVLNKAAELGASVLINNAGVSQFAAFESIDEQAFRASMELNLMAPVLLTQGFLNIGGDAAKVVVNVGSALGAIGFPFYTSYCTSKFALRGFTEALGRELAGSNDRVLYFAPRATQTDMNSAEVNAMNKALGNTVDSPEAVAKALVAQIEKGTKRGGIGWPEQFFAKLNSVVPQLVDKAMFKKLKAIRQFVQNPHSQEQYR